MTQVDFSKGNYTAETVCGALFRTDFELIGESAGGRETWWHRGPVGRNVKIGVIRPADKNELMVVVFFVAEHPLIKERAVARKEFAIDLACNNEQLAEAAQMVVEQCLLIYRQVISEQPVA